VCAMAMLVRTMVGGVKRGFLGPMEAPMVPTRPWNRPGTTTVVVPRPLVPPVVEVPVVPPVVEVPVVPPVEVPVAERPVDVPRPAGPPVLAPRAEMSMDDFDSMCGVPIIAPVLNPFVPSGVIRNKLIEMSRALGVSFEEESLRTRTDRRDSKISKAIRTAKDHILKWEQELADYEQLRQYDDLAQKYYAALKRALDIERRQWIEVDEDEEAGVQPLDRPMPEFVVNDAPPNKKARVVTLASMMANAGDDPLLGPS